MLNKGFFFCFWGVKPGEIRSKNAGLFLSGTYISEGRGKRHEYRGCSQRAKVAAKQIFPSGSCWRTAVKDFHTELLFKGRDAPDAPPAVSLFVGIDLVQSERVAQEQKVAQIVAPFLSVNFPLMDDDWADYLVIFVPAWCGR